MNVPKLPEMRWDRDGRPDFSHLDGEASHLSMRDQLQALVLNNVYLDTDNGDSSVVREVYPDSFVYEVVEDGVARVLRRGYTVEDGKAVLDGDAERIAPEQFAILSRRRIPKNGVPEMATEEEAD